MRIRILIRIDVKPVIQELWRLKIEPWRVLLLGLTHNFFKAIHGELGYGLDYCSWRGMYCCLWRELSVFRIRIDGRRFDAELGPDLDRYKNGNRQQNFAYPQHS
jgi:hypothetical protein